MIGNDLTLLDWYFETGKDDDITNLWDVYPRCTIEANLYWRTEPYS